MDSSPASEQARLEQWLAAHGYRLQRRRHEWHECLLAGADESWLGHGESAALAFEDVLRRAFPSRLARRALDAALAGGASEPVPPIAAPEDEGHAPAPLSAPAPLDANTLALAQEVHEAPAPLAFAEPETTSSTLAFAATKPERRLPVAPRLARERALAQGQEILSSIQADAREVAAWSPARQRLAILIWIARARDVQSANGEREVKDLVHACARELGLLSARWWPGSVTALQEATYPAACAGELELEPAPGTWAEVAQAAEQRLEELEAAEEAEGADEDGWWDAAALEPAHREPTSALREAVRKLETATGPLAAKPHAFDPHALAPDERVRLAKTLRWIRDAAADVTTHGDALGRLRWVAWKERDRELAGWLDPRRRPLRSWALELGHDPEKSARRERRRAVLRALPAADAPVDAARLGAWLGAAFECSELEVPRLASLLRPFAALVSTLPTTKEFWPERKHRTKLTRLQELLAAPPADLPERERLLAEELADSASSGEPAVALAAPNADPAAALLAEILPWTRGLRALLVTNRNDPELDHALQTTLELAALDHEIALPRRIDALTVRIEAGRYDLVLSATGFQSHSTSERLEAAARRAAIPCVRIHRARRLACIRALHRDRPGALRAGR